MSEKHLIKLSEERQLTPEHIEAIFLYCVEHPIKGEVLLSKYEKNLRKNQEALEREYEYLSQNRESAI